MNKLLISLCTTLFSTTLVSAHGNELIHVITEEPGKMALALGISAPITALIVGAVIWFSRK